MPVKKIGIFYGHVASNIGDIAINRGEIKLLRQAFPRAVLHFVQLNSETSQYLPLARSSLSGGGANNLSFFSTSHEKALTYQLNPTQFLRDCMVADADLVVLASGEHLFYYAHGENDQALFWRTLPALAAKISGKRCIMLPSTFGPFEDDRARQLIGSLLETVDGFAVRDAVSARLLATQCGIASPPKALLDPAFFLSPPERRKNKDAADKTILGMAMRSEGWGIRLSLEHRRRATDHFESSHYEDSHALKFAVSLASRFLSSGDSSLRIFVQTVADEALANSVQNALSEIGLGEAVELHRPVSLDDYLSKVSQLDCMVASRFHAVVLAMTADVPVFGTYFDVHGHKMPGLFELFAISGRCVNLSTVPPDEAAQSVLNALTSRSQDAAAVREKMERLKGQTVSWLKATGNRKIDAPRLSRAQSSLAEFSSVLFRKGLQAAFNSEKRALAKANEDLALQVSQIRSEAEALRQQLAEARIEAQADASRIRGEHDRLIAEASGRSRALERERDARKAERDRLRAELDDMTKRQREEREAFQIERDRSKAEIADVASRGEQERAAFDAERDRLAAEVTSISRCLDQEREAFRLEREGLTAETSGLIRALKEERKVLQDERERLLGEAADLGNSLELERRALRQERERLTAEVADLSTALDLERKVSRGEREQRVAEVAELSRALGLARKAKERFGVQERRWNAERRKLLANLKHAKDAARAAHESAVNSTDAMRQTIAFQLGALLINARKSGRRMARLPRDLWQLRTAAIARRRSKAAEQQKRDEAAVGSQLAATDDRKAPADGNKAPSAEAPRPVAAAVAKPPTAETPRPVAAAVAKPPVAEAPPPVAAVGSNAPSAKELGPGARGENKALSADELARMYKTGGADLVIREITGRGAVDKGQMARQLIQAGERLCEVGVQAQYALARAALDNERSEPVLRNFMWAALQEKSIGEAYEVIQELERLYRAAKGPGNPQKLEALQRVSAYQMSVLDLMAPANVAVIDPVRNRVGYVLHNSLPYSSGGYATRAHGVSSGLREAGYDVAIVSRPGFPLDMKPNLTEADVPVTETIDGITYHRIFTPPRKGLTPTGYMHRSADALEGWMREVRPEFVMAASNYLTALPALVASRRCGIPFIYEIRGFWEVTRMSREREFLDSHQYAVLIKLETEVAKRADHIFTLTEQMRAELHDRGVPLDKIDLLPNSCDPERFCPVPKNRALAQRLGIPDGVPVIGYVGTFVDYEGLEDLAQACGLLKEQGLAFRLLLVGNENVSTGDRGPIMQAIADIAGSAGFADWLIMPGRVPHGEVQDYYSLIDICPFPRKPWPVCEMVSPMKPLEALAMEKALLVSSVRALAGMVRDGETGLVYEKGNTADMAEKLKLLMADKSSRRALGVRGRKWVETERTWTSVGRMAAPHLERLRSKEDYAADVLKAAG